MQKAFLPVMLFFFWMNLAAQDNLQRGYILRDQNDTVYGFIDDKNYYFNSIFCDFKADHTDSLERLYPGDLYGYRFIDDKFYITKEIKLGGKDSLVFLEYLIHGKVDFYFMQDKARSNHYYATDGIAPLVELLYKKEVIHKDGKDYLKENNQYLSVLEFLTRATPELEKTITILRNRTTET